jgi:cysteine desulfurase
MRLIALSFSMRSVYLDYNATTPLDSRVLEAMTPFMTGHFGNPSSIHHIGRTARAALDDCRYRVSHLWRCKPSEVIFTSGGTESNNLAIIGAARSMFSKGAHLITSAVEHHAVLHCFQNLARSEGFDLSILPVSPTGIVDPADLEKAIRPETTLVSVMAANNETGSVQSLAEISSLCQKHGLLFHCDAVQAFGKLPFSGIDQFGADLVSVCAHKFFGPKGAGALFCRSPLLLPPLFRGGAQENESRPGTENLSSIVGFTTAQELFVRTPIFDPKPLSALSQRLVDSLSPLPGVAFQGHPIDRLPNTTAFTVDGWDSISLLAALDLEGICASSGSACSVGSLEPSHVLLAMGLPLDQANSLVRFSLGPQTTSDDIDYTIDVFKRIVLTTDSSDDTD